MKNPPVLVVDDEEFNENRGCIEIILKAGVKKGKELFNENRGCIEMW